MGKTEPTVSMMETGALILQEMHKCYGDDIRLLHFRHFFKEVHPEATVLQISKVWERYMGFDGRVAPTHDYRTGNRK